MTMLKRIGVLVLPPILLATVFLATTFAHGGEDHGKQPVVTPTGQMNVKVADSDGIEVVVKYPTPKPAEEITMLVLLTDVKTNAPIAGATVSLAIKYVVPDQPNANNPRAAPAAPRLVEVTAVPTGTPGIYQARVTFPEAGEYNAAVKLNGEHLAAEVHAAGIVVPGTEAQAEGSGMPERTRLPLAIVAVGLYVLAGVMSYLFWLRSRRTDRASELKPIYTVEYER